MPDSTPDHKTEDLRNSIPGSGEQQIKTLRGFFGEDEAPIAVVAHHTEGGETQLELRVTADWTDVPEPLIAYLSPVDAVLIGERLVASGRAAQAAIVAGLEQS